ncbi:SMI1/KNR4 family protein [Flaviramulus sp. BrNp1-15]|uniref:SMI1/KNR4 family protein n=1 Tax=Flaviramulus sp. BrNp1-15 TaxID=2916754 RepID=UPI001EE8D342|nr:SMI1/KNR4 family protein [Flaviramulus sp. BrNp1-15]ULC58928.1 SMI1/KNR4 family protein [Flaviramulus sp. BrNp1-15]
MTIEKLRILFKEIYKLKFDYQIEGVFSNGSSKQIIYALEKHNLPQSYIKFQKNCGHISALDIHNGYWLDKGEKVLERLNQNKNQKLLIIGSDGGGNLFKLNIQNDSIYKTNPAGNNPIIISNSFEEFLEQLVLDWQHFLNGDASWKYIV